MKQKLWVWLKIQVSTRAKNWTHNLGGCHTNTICIAATHQSGTVAHDRKALPNTVFTRVQVDLLWPQEKLQKSPSKSKSPFALYMGQRFQVPAK